MNDNFEFIGPFGEDNYVFSIGGYKVPYISGKRKGENSWFLVLEAPGAGTVGTSELTSIEVICQVSFLASAMAVAAGFTSFGANSRKINPFDVKISALG